MTDDTRDKVIALEVKVDALMKKVDSLSDTVTTLNSLLLQAKGARWVLGIMIAVGGFASGMLAKYLPFSPR